MRWHCLQLACQWPNNKITINVRRWHWHHCTAESIWRMVEKNKIKQSRRKQSTLLVATKKINVRRRGSFWKRQKQKNKWQCL